MRSKNKELMISIKKYIEEYALENGGKTPNVDQIGEFMKMTHVSAYRYLKAMDAEGMIQYERGKIRTELIDKLQPGNAFSAITGSIPCGPEDERYEEVEEYVQLPPIFINYDESGKFFILHAQGESMIDAGIEDGDLVIIKKQNTATVGDIVAVLIDNKSTLKKIYKDSDGLYIWAENESWSDDERFYGREFSVQGVAIKVVKSL